MYRLLILALAICSTHASPKIRIHRGNASAIGEAPYMVSIYQKSVGLHVCGGSIISPEYILTAAHCFDRDKHYNPRDYRVRVGSTRWALGGRLHIVADYLTHEDYDSNKYGVPFNDIALIRLTKPVVINNVTTKVIEVFNEEVKTGLHGFLTGWGLTEEGRLPDDLKSLSVEVLPKETCRTAYADYGGFYENQFCATYENGNSDFCGGDSGSPLVIEGKQAGLVSYNGPECAEKGRPGVYTEVGKYRDWIDGIISSTTTG